MNAYLDTERLTSRHFTADDAELLFELDSDPAVMRYLTGGEPTPPEHYRERGPRNILAGYARSGGDFGLVAAHDKDRGDFIGWFLPRPEKITEKGAQDVGVKHGSTWLPAARTFHVLVRCGLIG